MKSKLLFLTLSVFTLVMGCKNADDDVSQDPLDGVWHLTNVSGGIQGIDLDYDRGEVIWTFNMAQNSLIIENTIVTTGPKDIHAGLDSGAYTIEIQEDAKVKTLFVSGNMRGILQFEGSVLRIDDGVAADGFASLFGR